MNLEALKLFVEVTGHGSFAAVARSRDADPSSISRVISGLEDELGVRLFHRSTRRLSLTEAGQIYLARVEPLITELEAAQYSAKDVSSAPSGKLRVTTSITCGQRLITPLLKRFRVLYPDVSLELILTDKYVDLVAERIDIAVRLGPRQDNGFVGVKLAEMKHFVCAAPSYIEQYGALERPEELSHRDCLLVDLPGFKTRWLFKDEANAEITVPVQGNVVISNMEALRYCALNGMGPVLLADWVVRDNLERGELVNLFPSHRVTASDFETAIWALYPSRSHLPMKVRVFLDFLKANLGNPPEAHACRLSIGSVNA